MSENLQGSRRGRSRRVGRTETTPAQHRWVHVSMNLPPPPVTKFLKVRTVISTQSSTGGIGKEEGLSYCWLPLHDVYIICLIALSFTVTL